MNEENWVCGDCGKTYPPTIDFCTTERWIHDLAGNKWNQGRREAETKAKKDIKEIVNAMITLSKHGLFGGEMK